MQAKLHQISEIESDHPVALLHRKKVMGEKMLVAEIHLEKGCSVDIHSHESEQMSCQLSGKVLWKLGDPTSPDYREVIVDQPTIIELPAWFPHGVETLEDAWLIDILSPVGLMGVDKQGK